MRALIVKTSALGDIVQSYPVVEYLRNVQKVERIGWVVEKKFAALVKAHPFVDDVIEIDTEFFRTSMLPWKFIQGLFSQRQDIRSQRWDVVFDLQANCKSGFYTFFARSPCKVGYGMKTAAEWPNILVTNHRYNPPKSLSMRDEYVWMVRRYFEDEASFEPSHLSLKLTASEERMLALEVLRWPAERPVWMLAVGSNWPNKMCDTSALKRVLSLVREKYNPYFVFVAGNGEELKEVGVMAEMFCLDSHVMYRPELPVLQRVMDRAKAVLAVDSLLLHLAATTGTPTFGFFGPSLGNKYAPSGKKSGYFQGSCPFDIQFEKRCPFLRTCQEGFCLKKADPTEMFQTLDAWLSRQ